MIRIYLEKGQFIIDGYHAFFRFDCIGNGGELLLYVREDISTVLNEMDIIDNKIIWQTIKPFLSKKLNSREKLNSVAKEELVSSESYVAKCFIIFL